MKISDRLLCLFSGQIEEQDGSYIVEIPEQELQLGEIDEGNSYRIAVVATPGKSAEKHQSRQESEEKESPLSPPVDEGETRVVDIESIGDQGDGITRVERGFVVVVPDTEKGERVRVEITDVRENVAFANMIERLDYYE